MKCEYYKCVMSSSVCLEYGWFLLDDVTVHGPRAPVPGGLWLVVSGLVMLGFRAEVNR
jgi:hypothetical protein